VPLAPIRHRVQSRPVMRGPPVEVRKTPESNTWYNASIVDINGDNIVVAFEDDIWPRREVEASLVRRCAPPSVEPFSPPVGAVVEVAIVATESNPAGWSLGRVKQIKSWFYFVTFEGPKSGQDLIVEQDGLRQVNTCAPIDPSQLTRKLVAVDRGLHSWVKSRDSLGCLSDVVMRSSLLTASATTARGPPKVALVGDEEAVALGEKLLVEIHFKNQAKMQRFHEHRERLMEKIRDVETTYNKTHRESFTVDPGLVGRIIGSKGSNITKLRNELEVEIHIDDGQGYEELTTITVTGESKEACIQAREQMEYVTERIQIASDQVGWVVGKGYENLQDIQKKADLRYLRYNDKMGALELCGLQAQVDDARLMLNVHMEYLGVYQDMSKEQQEMTEKFNELEAGKGKRGKGKEGKKGESKGGGKYEGKGETKGDRKGEGNDKGKGAGKEKGSGESKGGGKEKGGEKGKDKGKDKGKGKGEGKSTQDDDDESDKRGGGKGDKGKGKGKKASERSEYQDWQGWSSWNWDDYDAAPKGKGKDKGKADRKGGKKGGK